MNGEYSLYALVIYDSAHREGFVNPAASACDYRAGKYLDTLLVAFFDSAVHIDHIAYLEMRYILLEAFTISSLDP